MRGNIRKCGGISGDAGEYQEMRGNFKDAGGISDMRGISVNLHSAEDDPDL